MDEIVFLIEEDPSGGFTARAAGVSIYTQSDDIDSIEANVRDAVRCQFGEAERPSQIRFILMSHGGCQKMGARLFRIILPVSDMGRAVAFYTAVLGKPGMQVSPGRCYFDCGGVILACFDPNADGDGYTAAPLPEHLYFAVDDLQATYDACQKSGATLEPGEVHGDPAGAIVRRPWGERSFYARDPFGNWLCFVDAATVFTGG